jgi:hypothetical protein
MDFFDFITQEELDELPDDPQAAFLRFAQLAQRRLREVRGRLNLDDGGDWDLLNEARHGFMNVMLAVAKRFEIEPFSSMDVPPISSFDDRDHKQFKADLDHYIAQVAIGNSIRGRRDSVFLSDSAKDRIRTYLRALRSEIEKADLGEAKRSALLDKLKKFEDELEKRRLTLLELTRIIIAVAAVPGAVWASIDLTMKLVGNVMQVVGEARAVEESERSPISHEPLKALSPPRKDVVRGRASEGLIDDDIPF